jgi:hypothetical protein
VPGTITENDPAVTEGTITMVDGQPDSWVWTTAGITARKSRDASGSDIVAVYWSIVDKKNPSLVIELPSGRIRSPNCVYLSDDRGETVLLDKSVYSKSVGSLAEGLNSSKTNIPVGGQGIFTFVIPGDFSPQKLFFVYPYRGEKPKPRNWKFAELIIDMF